MRLSDDHNGESIQLFFPMAGVNIPTSFIPDRNMIISPTSDITMTLNNIPKNYSPSDVFGLKKGVLYTFNDSFNAHEM